MKKIIPCLDVKDGKTVKGVNFVDIKNVGDPIEMAQVYDRSGADELVLLDITATNEKRKTFSSLVAEITKTIQIPLTVGGGIATVKDAAELFEAGAAKVSINSAAVKYPQLINDIAGKFGKQKLVVAIDTKLAEDGEWYVYTHGGKKQTELKTIAWADEVVRRGAGSILLTSMSNDGTKAGFAVEITRSVAEAVDVPVIASGGAGKMEDFVEILKDSKVAAALAAGIFHYGEVNIGELKQLLIREGVQVSV